MLEDFMPKDSDDKGVKGGDVIKPASEEVEKAAPDTQKTTPPAGPYRPSILNQNKNTVEKTTTPTPLTLEQTPKDKIQEETNMKTPQTSAKKSKLSFKKAIKFLLIFITLGGVVFAAWWFGLRDTGVSSTSNNEVPSSNPTTETKPESESKLVIAPLSGVAVDPALAARPVTAVMIENSEEARPQSGLIDADLVFEAIAEGGITRFLALFQSKKPEYIGPIRSARPYYVEWAKTFDASYVHAGGSPDGLSAISSLEVKDVSAFAYGEDVFYRTTDRQSPHNLYSSFKGLDKVNQDKGFTSSKFTPWNRKNDVPQTPTAKTIDISISSAYFNPSYIYDQTTNTYLRSEGGEVHKDEKSGKQLSPKTVLVLVMNRSQDGIYSVYKTNGSGKFYAFQDGIVSEGTWSRATTTDQYTFKDSNGFDYLFNKGQVWVSVVASANSVKYAP